MAKNQKVRKVVKVAPKAETKAPKARKGKAKAAPVEIKRGHELYGKRIADADKKVTKEGLTVVQVYGKKEYTFDPRKKVEILGHGSTSIFKWMGKNGYSAADARTVCENLGILDQIKPSTITTGVADGKNPKYNAFGTAELSKTEIAELKSILAGKKVRKVVKVKSSKKSKKTTAA